MMVDFDLGTKKQKRLALCFGIFGYVMAWYFLLAGLLGPPKTAPTYFMTLFVVNFEILLYLVLIIAGPPAFGLGWMFIFILATYRQRVATAILFSLQLLLAYTETKEAAGGVLSLETLHLHDLSWQDWSPFVERYLAPLLFCLTVIAYLLFRTPGPDYRSRGLKITFSQDPPPSPPPATPPG